MKAKHVRQWIHNNPGIERDLIHLQALWRGYAVRYRLKLAGPGVLKRSMCHNDEEMVTCESKDEVSPFDYFSVVEADGKIWWFDQRSMIEWSQTTLEIRNPFTRSVLSSSDASRLRHLMYIRKKRGYPVTHSVPTFGSLDDLRDQRWMRVVQILHECGFVDLIHHENFIGMRYVEVKMFMDALIGSMRVWMYESIGDKDPYILVSKRAKYHTWLVCTRKMISSYATLSHLSRDIATLLLACLNDIRSPGELAFFVLTAYTKSMSAAAGL